MSNETKFTPGPWFISGNMTKYVEARIAGGMIQEVAACGPTESDGGYGEQQLANAQLIAAAPEIYKELAAMIEWFDSPMTIENEDDEAIIASAKQALAKARGDQ